MLLLFADAGKEWSALEVSRTLYTRLESAAAQLQTLHRAKLLLVIEGGESPNYRFHAASPEAATVADLEKVYKTRRVSVISFIYSKPTDPLRAFSDAFRLRKDEP